MKETVSVFAFSPYIKMDDLHFMLDDDNKSLRPVMSGGQMIVPLAFFEKGLGMGAQEMDGKVELLFEGKTLTAAEGNKAYAVDGSAGEFVTAPRRERGTLCLPAVECAKALGIPAEQFDLLAVFGSEDAISALRGSKEEQENLAQKTCGVYNAAYFTKEDFKQARDAWRYDLCGDAESNDLSIPGMKNLLEMRDQDSEALRAEMNRGENIPILFGSEPPVKSAELKLQYDRILRMAQPYGTVGCRGYKSKELLDDILFAMDWMHDNMYGAKVLSDESYRSYKIFNWWEWYVGGADPMMDVVMIIEEDIEPECVAKYVLPMSFMRTQMRTEPELHMSRIISMIPLALLTNDRALLQASYLDVKVLLEERDTGKDMRRDWCDMTHGMPYNITYGRNNLVRTAKLVRILDGTPLAFTLPKKYNFMQMVRYGFATVVYRGQGLNLMNGRYMQSNAGATCALSIVGAFTWVFGMFGEEEDRELCRIIRRNATPEVRRGLISTYDTEIDLEAYRKINVTYDHPQVPKTHIASFKYLTDALNNPAYEWDEPYTIGRMWYSGDSCVQFRHDSLMGLRMNSERAPGYESINSANGDAWYTGDGMLYMYTPDDPEQYGRQWWKGVNKHLMPGTTADARQREVMFFDRAWKSSQSFVGGVEMDGQFITASMDLESFHCEVDEGRPDRGYGRSWPIHKCTLTAKKSYFMMDRAVVAIGTNVNAHDDYAVRTTVENRMLGDQGLMGVLVNGVQLPEDTSEFTRSDVKSIFIPRAGAYLFPQGGEITLRVYENEGRRYIAFWMEHGVNPENGGYAYIILPNASQEEYAAYDIGDVEILRNDGQVQAVREKHSGLTGFIFREACAFGGVEAGQPMIVMTQEKENGLKLVASDPTQKRKTFGLSVSGVKAVISCDARMTAEQDEGGATLKVECDTAMGRGYCAEFTR